MAPTKGEEAGKSGKNYVATGKPRGRRPGQKSKKTLKKEKAAEMRKQRLEKIDKKD